MKTVVLFTSHDTSRDFPNQCPQDGSVILLDWYESDLSDYLGPPPSQFPVAVISVNVGGVSSPNMVGMIFPTGWDDVVAAASSPDNSDFLHNIVRWGTYKSGQFIGDVPDLTGFEEAVINSADLSVAAKLSLNFDLITRYAEQPPLLKGYWKLWKSQSDNPSFAWLDKQTVAVVEQYAQDFNIPLI